MSGKKSALTTTVRPHLPGLKEIGFYLTKRWRDFPTKVALGALALDDGNRTHLMRTIGTFEPDEVVWFEPEPILKQIQESGAAKFVLWLSHPDGDPRPHKYDNFLLPDRVQRAIHATGCTVPLIDLVVVGYQSFYSWAIHGWDENDPLIRRERKVPA